MNRHKNAVTTYQSRRKMVALLEGKTPQHEVAALFGTSRRTVAKWWRRWKTEGEAGLRDRSSRPTRAPHKLAAGATNAVVHLRRTFWMPAYGIAAQRKLAYRTVCRYLKRSGISRKRDILPPQKPLRYERKTPGEIIPIDIKKLAKIDGVGHRIHGDRTRGSGSGWEYLHVAIDDHSRLAYSEILPDETGDSSLKFARNAVKWFKKHGVKTQRIMTDNGVGYKKRYKKRLKSSGIKHITTKPTTPKPTAKPSDSSERHSKNGPMLSPTATPTNAPPRSLAFVTSTTTTLIIMASTPHPLAGVNNVSRCNSWRISDFLQQQMCHYLLT